MSLGNLKVGLSLVELSRFFGVSGGAVLPAVGGATEALSSFTGCSSGVSNSLFFLLSHSAIEKKG